MKLVILLQEICLSLIDAILLLHLGGNNLHGQHIQIPVKLLHNEIKQDLSKYLEKIPCEYE